MIFASWSALTVALGALAFAAILFGLQRLRAHRRVVRIASAPLWSQAARAIPPRVLGGRFRRPLAFLLALLIALALWLAASRPEPTATSDGRFHHFVLDASALMTQGDSFARARAALAAQLTAVRARDRDVQLDDGTLLLAAGEDSALLPGRLKGMEAVPRPSGFQAWLSRTRAERRHGAVTVQYFGHRAVFESAPLYGPRPDAATRLIAGMLVDPVARNHGIVALGVSPAASGAWGQADVLVGLWDSGDPAPSLDRVRLRLAGRALTPAAVDALGQGRYLLRGVPAEGQSLDVAWREGDGFAADDSAAIRIPDRRAVAVAVGPGVPATILRALRLDPAFRIVAADAAQVVVRTANDRTTGGSRPALILTDPSAEAATFVVTAPADGNDVALADRLDALGLRQIDAGSLADDLGRAVAVREGATGRVRSIAAWRTVFSERTAFARSPALPLFVSQSLRWLAGPTPWIPYAQAATMLVDQSALYGLSADPGLDARRLGDGVYLSRAGDIDIAGQRIAVSLTDAATSRLAAVTGPAGRRDDPVPGGYPDPWISILLLAAALLLALEWRLFQRGWMP